MGKLPPLNALRAFEAAGRHLNFRLAAEEIGVTQGAVAQHVRGLEDILNVMLFERLPRGLALTNEGRQYHVPVRRAFELMATATTEILPHPSVLTISVTPSFAARWLVPRLGAFAEANPDINVRVDASQRLANFQNDGIDIAVRQGRPPKNAGLVSTLLCPQTFFAVCSPSMLAGDNPIRTLHDLQNHTLLHDSHGLWPRYLDTAFDGATTPNVRSMNFSQTSLAIDAAIAGQGVALASDLFVKDEVVAGRLCRLFDHVVSGDLGFYLVRPKRPQNRKIVERMWDWLITESTDLA